MTPEQWAEGALPVHPHLRGAVVQAIREAVAEEREACARTAENLDVFWGTDVGVRHQIAHGIRLRGEK